MQLDLTVSREALQALRTGATIVEGRSAIFEVVGPGAIDCLQGLLTNDIVAAGETSLSYGAMLTTKGMILLDPFVVRSDGGAILVLPASSREAALGHYGRVLPPRLARVKERTEEWSVAFLIGPSVERMLPGVTGEQLPAPSHLNRLGGDLLLARGNAVMPFDFLVLGAAPSLHNLLAGLQAAGAVPADDASLALRRVLAGWPALGAEVDEKTLPQEVRYEELGAVSYSKGCYTGQEVVARVHFRGHPNRSLRGGILPPVPIGPDRKLQLDGKEVGVLRTTVRLEDRTLAMATVRREVPADGVLSAACGELRLVPFPVAEVVPA